MIRRLMLAALVAVCVLPACSKGDSESKAASYNDTPYGRDVDRICNVERLSGALAEEEGYRAMASAMWLANNIESEDGRLLSAKVRQAAMPADKIAVLESEAKKVGLPYCDLVVAWSGDSTAKSKTKTDPGNGS
jgi:hypothetical protein